MRLENYYSDVVKKIVPDLEIDLGDLTLHRSWQLFIAILHPNNALSSEIDLMIHKCANDIAWLAYQSNCEVTTSPEEFIKKVIDGKRGEQNEIN